jgi:hypothetical protein
MNDSVRLTLLLSDSREWFGEFYPLWISNRALQPHFDTFRTKFPKDGLALVLRMFIDE